VQAFENLKCKLDETITARRSGAVSIPRKRLRPEVINKIADAKIKQLCIEINSTTDSNVLTLAQLIGETLKWTLWHKAKQNQTSLKEDGALASLINEAIQKSYYTSNAARRFLNDFKTNFMKTSYDMVRHSESYVPDVLTLNPQLEALDHFGREFLMGPSA
jgi:hypothetical protein